MTILDRSSGTVSTPNTTWTVTRSTGSYGTGTVLVVVLITNTTWSTPSGWTLRGSSVNNLGLYLFDRATAGESSFNFVTGAAGAGEWYALELSSGSTYDVSALAESAGASNTVTVGPVTPTVGPRHLFAVAGGDAAPTVTASLWTNSFAANGLGGHATGGNLTFSYMAERDVTGDGSTAYSTAPTFSSGGTNPRAAVMAGYINNAGDVTPPSVPTGLATTAVGATSAGLSWSAATDNVGVTGYELQIIGP